MKPIRPRFALSFFGLLVPTFIFFLGGSPAVRADGVQESVTSDFDAELARAADALESNHREEGLRILETLREKSALVPAWRARIGIFLAADALKGHDYARSLAELDAAPAAAIGLEPYRQMLMARALAGAGRTVEARQAWKTVWEADEPFAERTTAGRAYAASLASAGSPGARAEAARVLALVAASAPPADAFEVRVEALRLFLASGDRAGARTAARDLVLGGADPATLPGFARPLAREELSRLSPADRGRLGRLLVSGGSFARGIRLLRQDPTPAWPEGDRGANLVALAHALLRASDAKGAGAVAAKVPQDGSPADFDARLIRADLDLSAIERRRKAPLDANDPLRTLARRPFLAIAAPPAPPAIRAAARERLIRLAADAELFDEGLEQARGLLADAPGSIAGFEPLWKLGWERYRARDFTGARERFEALAGVYRDVPRERRLSYWRARCFDREGRTAEAIPLFRSLAGGEPADIYALFARRRIPDFRPVRPVSISDPSTAIAAFRRTDELLRLRLFDDAAAEARALPPTRGRDLRLAEAEFARGRFPAAAAAVKRAFPEIGTAAEGQVPDGWRRLFYPIELGGFLATDARQIRLDPALLRGLVRQESVFDADAHSRAGALGLTQLMPATARGLVRSVMRVRYRRAFLYDPSTNARLGAAYLKSLEDRFGGNPLWALAAYNGGPTRMARVLRENAGMPEDEIFESHPAYETRDYVRRVMLFAESYRALYPESPGAGTGAGVHEEPEAGDTPTKGPGAGP